MTVDRRLRAHVGRPAVGAAVLLGIYLLLSLLIDPGGSLGTDTGAKVATLDRMVQEGTWRPDVGYWAEEWDPDGAYHPLFDTRPTEEGEWVNVTTLPMLLAARPLYDLGGYRLALLLPMLGAVAAAMAARSLARRLAGPDAGTRTFWVVGLGGPMAVYALDLWEHSIGAGLMLWAVVALVRVAEGDGLPWAALAGLLLGASATMRTESFVVALAAVGGACVALLWQRRPAASVAAGAASVTGFALPWAMNVWLERTLGGNARTARVSGAAGREFWAEAGDRFREALVTWFGLPGLGYPDGVLAGGFVAGLLIGAVVLDRRGKSRESRIAAVFAGVIFALTILGAGLAFVSGALMASPIAIAAGWSLREHRRLVLAAGSLAATLGIWMFQFLGGAGPQWGGRYILAPTLVLTMVGAVGLARTPRVVTGVLVAMALLVSAFGVSWLGERSHRVDDFFADMAERPEDVIISTNGFLVREAGAAADDRRYLSLGRAAPLAGAVDVVSAAGFETYAVLTSEEELPDLPGSPTGVDVVEFLGVPLRIHSYRLDS